MPQRPIAPPAPSTLRTSRSEERGRARRDARAQAGLVADLLRRTKPGEAARVSPRVRAG